MYYVNVLKTKSFAKEPVRTVLRGSEWVIRQKIGLNRAFKVNFGPHQFRMLLQYPKRKFGSAGIFVQRQYYEPLLEFGSRFLASGDNVIDGGANQGIYSCAFASAVGMDGRVYAFEPQKYAVECLKENLKLNAFTNVVVFEGALSDSPGWMYLNPGGGPVEASISQTPIEDNSERIASYSIDHLLEEKRMTDVSFIKLDVEGAELQALRGAKSLVERRRPIICIEAYDQDLYSAILSFLGAQGYKPYLIDTKGDAVSFTRFVPSANVFFLC